MLSGAPLDEVFPIANRAAVSAHRSRTKRGSVSALPPRQRSKASKKNRDGFQTKPPLCDLLHTGYSSSMLDVMDTREPMAQQEEKLYDQQPARQQQQHPYYNQPLRTPYKPEGGMYMSYPFEEAINFYEDDGGDDEDVPDPVVDPPPTAASVKKTDTTTSTPVKKSDDILIKNYETSMYYVSGVVLILLMERFIQMGARLVMF